MYRPKELKKILKENPDLDDLTVAKMSNNTFLYVRKIRRELYPDFDSFC